MARSTESWGTRVGLVLAMAGNAVGLGNFLRFPVQAVQNGGGAFIIPYLVCFLLMGIPLLWVEWTIGRFGGKFGHHSTPFILDSMDKRRIWKYVGVFGIFTNLAVAAYYCYLESWTLSYTFHSVIGSFNGLSQDEVAAFFGHYVDLNYSTFGIPFEPLVFFIICLAMNTFILSRGLSKGVEMTSRIGMPLLIIFGLFLAYKGITLKAGTEGAVNDGTVGLNFLWSPKFESLTDPKVWLAAAGQIFFTLSVGMGSIQCYASYVKSKDDIALNAMSAGWMNEFVEVVLGSAIIIPIAIGYLGIDRVVELTKAGGLGLGFKTLPYLFQQWGPVLAAVAGVMWFGLLFFAGITSSLAMGTPCMGFLEDEFNWKRKNAALAFGIAIFILGLPTVVYFNYGVFDEYDYWAGTVSLVIFALAESILFAWVFGIDKSWKELKAGADIRVPGIYRYIIKYITPLLLLAVFLGAVFIPKDNDWAGSLRGLSEGKAWVLDNNSLISQVRNQGLNEEILTLTSSIDKASDDNQRSTLVAQRVEKEKKLKYVTGSRILLLGLFVAISVLVYVAGKKRNKNNPEVAHGN